jgi:hypothetical protein
MTHQIPRPDWVTDQSISRRGENAQFQMFTKTGNDAIAEMLMTNFKAAEEVGLPRDVLIVLVKNGVREIASVHPEVHDTEPEWAITDALNNFLTEHGFAVVSREVLF